MFKNGGWLNSTDGAFNQPSTYVGLQYVQRNPDLPPIDGLKEYLKEQERLRKEHEAYRKAAAPDDEKFGEILKGAQGKALTGQLSEFSTEYNRFRTEFARRFKGDEVFSDEAKQYLMTMNSLFGQDRINEMIQNKTMWEDGKKKVHERKIGGEVWTDGDRVLVRDNKTGETSVQPAHIVAKALETPEGRKAYSLLTNDEAISWKDKNWRLGQEDSVALGSQMSVVEINDMIDDVLTNIGHTASGSSGERVRNIKDYLASNGINVADGNVMQQISQKFKNNKAQLAEAQERIYALLPQEAKAGIIANMLASGENPYGFTEIDTPKGKQKVSNLGLKLQQVVGSAVGSRIIQESEQSSSFSSLGSSIGEENTGTDISWIQFAFNRPQMIEGYQRRDFEAPIDGQTKTIKSDYIPLRSNFAKEKFPWMNQLNHVKDGKEITFGGKRIFLKNYVELPGADGIFFVDEVVRDDEGRPLPDPNNPGEPLKQRIGYVQRYALVNSKNLEEINSYFGKSPKFEIGLISDKGINGAEAHLENLTYDQALKDAGIDPEKTPVPSISGNVYRLMFYERVNAIDAFTDDKNAANNKALNANNQAITAYDMQVENALKAASQVKETLKLY